MFCCISAHERTQPPGGRSKFLGEALSLPWKLSTSQLPQVQDETLWPKFALKDEKYLCCSGGFGPVASDGYGVSYMIAGEHNLFFHVSAKRTAGITDSARFTAHIHQALRDIRALFLEAGAESAKHHHKP
jgi:hypothetical protein